MSESEVKTKATIGFPSKQPPNHSDIDNQEEASQINPNARIISPTLFNIQLNKDQKAVGKSKLLLDEIVQLSFPKVGQQKKESKYVSQVEQCKLPDLKGRLLSLQEQAKINFLNKICGYQSSSADVQPQQKYYKSQSKAFSKIKLERSCQNQEETSQEAKKTEEKLQQQIDLLKFNMNKAKEELRQKQKIWQREQRALNGEVLRKDLLLKDYSERIKHLQAENKLLKKQRAMRQKQLEMESIQKQKQEQIQENHKSLNIHELPDLNSKKHSVSTIQIRASKETVSGSDKNLIQLFKLLNKLRKQLKEPQRKNLRLKIAQLL